MTLHQKHRLVTINAILALAITLVVNFSYLLFTLIPVETTRFLHDYQIIALLIQVTYFYIVSFILLTISTLKRDYNGKKITFFKKMLYCSLVSIVLYLITPNITKSGELVMTILKPSHILHPVLMLKCSLTLIVSLLYGKIYELIYQKQKIVYENELLRSENLESKYNILVSQINPHFFFNSLNSLTLLVREKSNDKALDYISTLSDTFRYIINNGHSGLVTLESELKFVESYKYLFEIRYEDKLFININVDSKLYERLIPSLSLQPLIENAVKHNVITRSQPLTIDIISDGNYLVVSNLIQVKLTPPDSTGIGLKNLASRFSLLSQKKIIITTEENKFIVKLPIYIRE